MVVVLIFMFHTGQVYDAALLARLEHSSLKHQWLGCDFLPHSEHSLSAVTTNNRLFYREIMSVYCESHKEHINTQCE